MTTISESAVAVGGARDRARWVMLIVLPELKLQATRRTGMSRQQPVNGRRQSPLSRTCFPIFELARQLLRRREPNCLQPQRRGR
jgi:hypothetical protein